MPVFPSLYLESTIPSYLAALPSHDLIVAAHQQVTRTWWQYSRPRFKLYISEAVLEEISAGDSGAAASRLSLIRAIPVLAITDEVGKLAEQYLKYLGLPARAELDTIHLACAVVYELAYLLTWNCKHLANGIIIQRLQHLNQELQRWTPVIVTPEELLDNPDLPERSS
jgi:hypothetical protein